MGGAGGRRLRLFQITVALKRTVRANVYVRINEYFFYPAILTVVDGLKAAARSYFGGRSETRKLLLSPARIRYAFIARLASVIVSSRVYIFNLLVEL